MQYFTYILESLDSGMMYIGSTNNLEDRIHRHNTNQNRFTKGKGPWKLLYSKSFETRAEAIQLERELKAMKDRDRVKRWISAQSG